MQQLSFALSLPLAYDPPAAAQTTQANELLTVPGHHHIITPKESDRQIDAAFSYKISRLECQLLNPHM